LWRRLTRSRPRSSPVGFPSVSLGSPALRCANAWGLAETPYNLLFFPEIPNTIPILPGGIPAQEFNSLSENTGRAVIRSNFQTFAKTGFG
jgi:hypothetical protein